MTRTVSLVVPGLAAKFAGIAAESYPAAPALSRLLGRARVNVFPGDYAEQVLGSLLGGTTSPTLAELTYYQDFGEWPARSCLRADPVHLRADSNGLILFDSAAFTLNLDESRALADTLAAHLAQDGLTLRVGAANRWYVLAEEAPSMQTTPLPLARGKPVSVTAAAGAGASAWRQRLNEIQMLMYAHPVNLSRAAAGAVAINSLWLWGEAALPAATPVSFNSVVSANPCAQAYASVNRLELHAIPCADELTAIVPRDARVLVDLDDCRDAAAYEDFQVLVDAIDGLERTWFAPLLRMLANRRIDALELLPVNGRCYRLTRAGLYAFWKGKPDYRRAPDFFSVNATRV